jgi:uncharacterized protein
MDLKLQAFFHEIADLPEFVEISPIGPHSRGNFGSTPLHIAAIRGDVSVIRALLEAGADIDAPGEDGYTPLHDSVLQGHQEAVRFLLERGASREIRNHDGETPSKVAALRGDAEMMRLLGSE